MDIGLGGWPRVPLPMGVAMTCTGGTPQAPEGCSSVDVPPVGAGTPTVLGDGSVVMRRAIEGRWDMRLDSDGQTCVPWIVDPSGRSYAPVRIYKELLEHGRSASMRAFVAGTIRAHLLGRQRRSVS